jgi:hypothetical protein
MKYHTIVTHSSTPLTYTSSRESGFAPNPPAAQSPPAQPRRQLCRDIRPYQRARRIQTGSRTQPPPPESEKQNQKHPRPPTFAEPESKPEPATHTASPHNQNPQCIRRTRTAGSIIYIKTMPIVDRSPYHHHPTPYHPNTRSTLRLLQCPTQSGLPKQ